MESSDKLNERNQIPEQWKCLLSFQGERNSQIKNKPKPSASKTPIKVVTNSKCLIIMSTIVFRIFELWRGFSDEFSFLFDNSKVCIFTRVYRRFVNEWKHLICYNKRQSLERRLIRIENNFFLLQMQIIDHNTITLNS